ncbi:aryl-sulfate sulfotransferase [Flagellimonas lutimaris]|uniref:aryl-sulfate sulfotransferase n=1 Tax=Flagellimonas lutimaris TaxID=475082 RepID=UPI003F5CC63E
MNIDTKLIFKKFIILFLLIPNLFSCSQDDNTLEPEETIQIEEVKDEEPIEDNSFTPIGIIEVFDETKIDDNYILVNDAKANRVYLMNKEAKLIHEWSLSNNIGNDVVLLPNGKLLAALESDDPKMPWGGKGGRIQFVEPDGTISWDYILSTEYRELHHDIEILPNGNIIALVWNKINPEDALNEGFMLDEAIYPESVIEINPDTDEIVWEWNSMDHLIQDYDDTKNNYGTVSENPQLIDLNYTPQDDSLPPVSGDIMHANAIAYDEVNDIIVISVNSYSEVWFIDHSTTTEEAATHAGGNYGKGGDLIYRFGNPKTYKNPEGDRLFHNNHFPNLLKGENQGKLLIFSNGNDIKQSTVYELELPTTFDLKPNFNNEPSITWSFTDPNLYSGKVSGAVILENGNILITEGDFGFWEVTREKEVIWKFHAEGFFWRGYHYLKDAPEINLLGL